ncbi:MAG: 2-isopropylmalate synthase [Polyangiaceae bacterium]|nr:2-isopropylmalate synthase [Polyangiaceae bacterium]
MTLPLAPDHVRIFDTTLRDGEQSPGATLTSAEKLDVARGLSRLGVDVIEAGFPAASPDDLEAVRTIARTVGCEPVAGRPAPAPPIVCALARAAEADIDAAASAVAPARHGRIHTFLATSPIHREHKLRMSRAEVVERARRMVGYARARCEDVEFSPEDAGRTEPEFLYEVLSAVIAEGATTLNIPDTVGYTLPQEYGALLEGIVRHVRGVADGKAIVSVHCHDDLGLAVANTLAGVRAGARQVEVTVNGIGERAGNTSLEEVVMALRVRRAVFGLETSIDTTQLCRTSKLVSTRTGIVVQPNKAIVGANAFAHESGIHQDGMLKHEETYEIMRPETVGAGRTQLVLGKHSGRAAFGARLAELGIPLTGGALAEAFERFKALAEKKKTILDADLLALFADRGAEEEVRWTLEDLVVTSGLHGMPTATVRLRDSAGEPHVHAAVGTGPVDAVFSAVDHIVAAPAELVDFAINAVTEGEDAVGEASVRVRARAADGRPDPQRNAVRTPTFHGHAADVDVIVASTRAYVAALNRLLVALDLERERGGRVPELVREAI